MQILSFNKIDYLMAGSDVVLPNGVRTAEPGGGRAEPEHGLEMTSHDPPLVLLGDE